jgi:flagellar protein FliO/FliZ
MFDLFGTELSLPVKFILAFVVVLALIAAATWLIRRFGGTRIGGSAARGRQPRLAVIDAASVDSRRRLVLIRRDNVEHLVLIGGPSDLVVEQNIVRAVPVAPAREAPPARGQEATPRTPEVRPEPAPRAPQAEQWTPEPAARGPRATEPSWAPPPEPVASRSSRAAEPSWTPPAEPRPRHAEPPAKSPPVMDLPTRPLPEPVAAALRAASPEPPRAPARAAAPRMPVAEPEHPVEVRQSPPTADVNLTDMAQRLEAALRRPGRPAEPRPAAEPVARSELRPRPASESAKPAAPAEPPRAPRPAMPREGASETQRMPREPVPEPQRPAEPETPPTATPEPAAPAAAAPQPAKPAEPAPKPAPGKSVFDSLEEEMASLLGKPAGKT